MTVEDVTTHEHIMEALCGTPTCLEVALAYIEAVQQRAPRYDYQLGRAIEEVENVLSRIRETQIRAVEWYRNNHDRASG
jgi:hypothetical protein